MPRPAIRQTKKDVQQSLVCNCFGVLGKALKEFMMRARASSAARLPTSASARMHAALDGTLITPRALPDLVRAGAAAPDPIAFALLAQIAALRGVLIAP